MINDIIDQMHMPKRNTLHCRWIISSLLSMLFILLPLQASAWGYQGHSIVGRLALNSVDKTATLYLQQILGQGLLTASDAACSWPDSVRETPKWKWSAPQHYVNIPRASSQYDRERDCPSGLCVTESIKKYAGELANPELDTDRRWQAYAWLCHLVGDLHQPLHAGYKDDRGANRVEISYLGESSNLHAFWDSMLIKNRIQAFGGWPESLTEDNLQFAGQAWNPKETDQWTTDSHTLAITACYPEQKDIQPEFAERSWVIIQEQILLAGQRLARILNATVGEGEVLLDR